MNALDAIAGSAWWHVAGWTMLHYLWMGALVGVAAVVSRVALRRASANVRYATALACLAVLAVLPVGIGIGVGQRIGVWDQVSGVGGTADAADAASGEKHVIEITRTPAIETPAAPGSARGVVELKRESRPVENVLANEPQTIGSPTTNPNPRPTTFSKQRGLPNVPAAVAVYLPWVWIVGAPLTFLLLTTGVVGAERLRRQSRILRDGPVAEAAARIAESLQIGRRVTIAVCERIAAPVLVGIVRPMILLPPAALTGWSPEEIEMVLLHELAHVRRWDNLVNLVQRMVEAVLFFQPAVWLVSNWVRREREACCDAVVVGRTNRPHAYAELLVALASQLPRSVLFHPAASSAMAAGPLRGRIRRILGIEDDPLLISGKSLGVVMSGLLLAATLAVLSVTTNTQAEEEGFTTESTEGTERNAGSSEAVPDIAALFVVSDNNPLTAERYAVSPKRWNGIQTTLESIKSSSLAKHFPFEFVLDSENSNVEIRTAKAAQRGYFKGLFNAFNQGLIGPHPRSGTYADWYLALAVEPVPAAWLANHEGFAAEGAEDAKRKLEVPFVIGATKFENGDEIKITEVRGTVNSFEPGSVFWIKGTYNLSSCERATLGTSVTARSSASANTHNDPDQSIDIERGSGEFTLKLPMRREGWPHVSFYPANGGQSFGGVYFGTGESVLMEWWGETEDTEGTQNKIDIAKKRAGTQNNLKDLAIALLNYESATKHFPTRAKFDADGKPLLSWRVLVLPYLSKAYLNPDSDEAKLYAEFHLDEPWDSDHNRKLIARMPAVFKNPQIGKPGMTNYLAVVGQECLFDDAGRPVQLQHVTDGTSRTIAIVEADADRAVEWTKPEDWEFDRERPTAGLGGLWPDRWYAAWVDGSVRSISNSESPDHIGIQFTRAGGETESLVESAGMGSEMMVMDDGMGRGMVGEMGMGRGMEMGGEMMGGRGGEMGMGATPATGVPANKFPTLEEQKLADVVYRQLGLELEPLTADDLLRVRALGFEGGMKVSLNDGSVISWERNRAGIVPNDILVGLHVWPTTSAADVVAVLERNDLAELNPLKYYAVRPGEPSGGGFGPGRPEPDTVGTGRITVRVRKTSAPNSSRQQSQPRSRSSGTQSVAAYEPVPVPPLTKAEQVELMKKGPFTLHFYFTPDSRPCGEAEKKIAEYEKALPGMIQVERINVAAQPALAVQQNIRVVPTLQLSHDGQDVGTKSGTWSVAELEQRITQHARRSAEHSTARRLQPNEMLQAIRTDKSEAPYVPVRDTKNVLLYDGKTFNVWRSAWKTELSMENRLEAVKALAAFGANGQGKEAAEAIMEVAEQQDWAWIDDTSAGKLRQACVDAFTTGQTTGGYHIPAHDWFPLVKPVIAQQGEKLNFATYIQIPRGEKSLIPELIELTKDPATKNWGMWGLKNVDPGLEDERTHAFFLQRLQETKDNPQELSLVLRSFLYSPSGSMFSVGQPDTRLRYTPELDEYLFHPDEQVQQSARYAFAWIQPENASAVVTKLLKVAEDEKSADRVSAIRALAAMGPKARAAEKELLRIAQERAVEKAGADDAFFASVAALLLMSDATLENWDKANCERIFGADDWNKYGQPWFADRLREEEQQLFPADLKQTLGGGGGMF